MTDLLEAFAQLGTGGDLTEIHRQALLAHLKATIPKAERKALRDQALVETILRLEELGLDLYAKETGAIVLAADLFMISERHAARVWEAYDKTSSFV